LQEEFGRKPYDKLLPPLVHKIRQKVKDWRDRDYEMKFEDVVKLFKMV